MKEMSQQACELVHAGREAFRPTEADRARLMAAVTGAASLSVGAAAAAAAHRSWGSIWGAAHAARVLAVALPVAAAGTYFWHATEPSPPKVPAALQVSQPRAVVAKAPVKPAAPVVTDPAVEQAIEPSATVSPERSASPAGEPTKPANQISQEVALLSKAQAALSRGRPQEALEALSEHALRFPRGALIEERTATRARTLCALGRIGEAETELKRLERLNPSSAYLARARESCGAK
jgi:hypothetical protein